MPQPDLAAIRSLFERAEAESDPSRKFAALEEAFDLVDLAVGDSNLPQVEKALAENLCHAHIRGLLKQLIGMQGIRFDQWENYIRLLILERQTTVDAVLAEAPDLQEGYQAFLRLWRDEFLDKIERMEKAQNPRP